MPVDLGSQSINAIDNSVAASDPPSASIDPPRPFTSSLAPPSKNFAASLVFPPPANRRAFLNKPLVTSSKTASVVPVAVAFSSKLPVFVDGSFSNSSSNFPPAALAPKAISPPTPVVAATKEGADLNAPSTVRFAACA